MSHTCNWCFGECTPKLHHVRHLKGVHGQMYHLCRDQCENNAATKIMANNFLTSKKSQYEDMRPSRAIAVGESGSNPIRVANLIINSEPWDDVILVGDLHGPLYDKLKVVKTPSELPKINSFDPEKRTLVIFDECGHTTDRKIMVDFSIRSRMRGVFTLFVECSLDDIPAMVRKNTDVLYLTSTPRWDNVELQMFYIRAPVTECFAGVGRTDWMKIDLRNDRSEIIDASKYYP